MKTKIKVLIIAGIILTASAFLIPKKSNPLTVPESEFVAAASTDERVNYFALHGWEVEEIGCKSITIPADFSAAYEQYAQLQDKQGMPLREYAGKDAQLYVYEVKNYSPESKNLLAELLVCDDTAVASMVYSDDGGELKMAVN